jgi:predicted nucleic acid-binding protein
MGTVVQLFPAKQIAYRIPLYGEFEVKLTVAIINLFSDGIKREQLARVPPFATISNLKLYSPEFVIDCLRRAHNSEIFSIKGRTTILKILANTEEIKLHKEA